MSDKTLLAYGSGSGNEIFSGKMNALRSSSALTYNLFGNGDAKIIKPITRKYENNESWTIGTGTYTVEFEKQFHTLNPSVSRWPANLDAFLYCEETQEAIACEMKMLEWLSTSAGELKEAYLNPKNYTEKRNPGNAFADIANDLVADKKAGVYKRYDAFQMFKHTVACYTACATSEEKREIKKLTLLNCVWTLPDLKNLSPDTKEDYEGYLKSEHIEAKKFISSMESVKSRFDNIGVKFNIVFCEFHELLSCLDKTEDELAYLKRYTFDFTEENR